MLEYTRLQTRGRVSVTVYLYTVTLYNILLIYQLYLDIYNVGTFTTFTE